MDLKGIVFLGIPAMAIITGDAFLGVDGLLPIAEIMGPAAGRGELLVTGDAGIFLGTALH